MPDTVAFLRKITPVSRETEEKLTIYAELLRKWQKSRNLVSSSTLSDLWQRHFADSLQLLDLGLPSGHWIDLGSGAGFPGLVIAIAGEGRPGHHVHLIESNQGKCAFLEEVVRATQAPATIHRARAENYGDKAPKEVKTITARALAPLDQLCSYVETLLSRESVALFPKGRRLDEELLQAKRFWRLDYQVIPSKTDPQASILRIRHLEKI